MYQQGDVILMPVDQIPQSATKKRNNHLAEGEMTGHFHNAVGDGVAVLEKGEGLYLDAPNGCEVEHQEHKTISVPAGKFKVIGVREYDHFAEEARRVED